MILKDSYAIITMPLKKFGKCFALEQEKEILPYSMYTAKNIEQRHLTVAECKNYCNQQVRCDNLDVCVDESDYEKYFKHFIENASKWGCLKEGVVDVLEYSKIYCERDVDVLKQGYSKFGEMLKESCESDIKDYMSASGSISASIYAKE